VGCWARLHDQVCTYDCHPRKGSNDDAGYCTAAEPAAAAGIWLGHHDGSCRTPSAVHAGNYVSKGIGMQGVV
jgi:hypothetical protein